VRPQLNLDEGDGYRALREHVVERARLARSRYGPAIDAQTMEKILQDPDVVRFPTRIVFDAEALVPGEFAFARPVGKSARDGFEICIHTHFEDRPELIPLLAAYHVPSINYLDVATRHEAELFGAALLGLDVEDYYTKLCELADAIPGPKGPEFTEEIGKLLQPDVEPTPAADAGCCGSGSGHGGGCGSSS